MTCRPNNFNHNGMENIWSKFELRATFPLGTTQSGNVKKYRIFSSLFRGINLKSKKCLLGITKAEARKNVSWEKQKPKR